MEIIHKWVMKLRTYQFTDSASLIMQNAIFQWKNFLTCINVRATLGIHKLLGNNATFWTQHSRYVPSAHDQLLTPNCLPEAAFNLGPVTAKPSIILISNLITYFQNHMITHTRNCLHESPPWRNTAQWAKPPYLSRLHDHTPTHHVR